MAGTTGSLKALIESAALGVLVVRDRLPHQYRLPAVILSDAVDVQRKPLGDYGDRNVRTTVSEMCTVDLYQAWRSRDGQPGESPTLADDLMCLLDGAQLLDHSRKVYGVRVTDMQRLVDADQPNKVGKTKLPNYTDGADVVHHALTVIVERSL